MKKLIFFFVKLNYLKNTINQEEIGISKEKNKRRKITLKKKPKL